MNKKIKDLFWNLIKFGITVFALGYLFMNMDLATFAENIVKVNPLAILFGGVIVFIIMLLKVVKWRMLIGMGDTWFLMKSYFVAMFFGAFTPSKLGDFVRGFHLRKKYGLSLTRSMSTVLYDRLLDVLCVFIYGIASIALVFSAGGGDFSMLILMIVGVVGVLISYFKLGWVLGVLMKIFGRFINGGKMNLSAKDISSEVEKISSKRKDIFIFSFVIWFINYFIWWIFALLIGFNVNFFHLFAATNIATVIGLIPITVGGFGTRELSSVYLLVFFGYDQGLAFLFTIISTTLGLIVPALIGAFFNIRSKDLKY